MPDILSDADVFGPAVAAPKGKAPVAAAPPPAPAPKAPTTLSNDDVFGKGKGGKSLDPLDGNGPKGPDNRSLLREGVAVADLFTTGPIQMIADVMGQTVGRVVAGIEGASRKEASAFGKEFGHDIASHPAINQPLTKLFNWVAGQKDDKTRVDDVMGEVSALIRKGGKYVQKVTKGAIRADDVDLMTEAIMAGAGGRGQQKLLEMRKKAEPAPTPEPPKPEGLSPEMQAKYDRARGKVDPATRARADAAAGVKEPLDPRAQKAATSMRRAEARKAFQDDPEYADYLRNYAEEEARLRANEVPQSAPGGVPGSGPRAPRTGLRDAVPDKELPPGRTKPVDAGNPPALDSALAKVKGGKSFDLTAEEKVQLRAIASKHGRPEFVDEAGRPIKQSGAATVDMMKLIAGLGLGTGLAAYAYYHKDEFGGAAAMALGALLPSGERTALSSMLRDSGSTLKTLERLNQGATSHTREQVLQHLNRDDVSKSEKDLVMGVLGDKKEISSKELVEGFQKEAKKLELKPKKTSEYAEYGLGQIDRQVEGQREPGDLNDLYRNPKPRESVDARTTIYRNDSLDDTNNHFEDPKYFAHTRSFDEGGVRHVVEVQSDVAQHTKTVPEAEAAKLRTNVEFLTGLGKSYEDLGGLVARAKKATEVPPILDDLEKQYDPEIRLDYRLQIGNRVYHKLVDNPKIKGDPIFTGQVDMEDVYNGVKDALKNPKKGDGDRLSLYVAAIQESLYEEGERLTRTISEMKAKLGAATQTVQPMLKTWYKRVVREEIAQTPGKPVRFATADTVAKVEGWPQNRPYTEAANRAEMAVRRAQKQILATESRIETARQVHGKNGEASSLTKGLENDLKEAKANLKMALEDLTHNRAELKKRFPNGEPAEFSKEHQSIYDRYKTEIEKFLRNEFKAKPYTDPKGHTWLEVPPQPKGPVKMFGRADPSSLAALAAFVGGAMAMQAWSKDPSLVSDVVAGLLASSATRIRPRALIEAYKSAKASKPLESIGQAAIVRESNMRRNALDAANTVLRVTKLVKDEKRREAVHVALDTGKVAGLSANELAAYNDLKAEYARLAKMGLDADTLKSARINYATHIWKMETDRFEEIFGKRRGFGTSPNTPYSLERVFNTLEEGERAGLTPVSKDAAFVYSVYANSLSGAIENARILKTIKAQKTEAGDHLMLPTKDAPHAYVAIENPQLRGQVVHPEIASQMRFIFENPSASGITSAAEIIADVSKRSAVSASMFHTKALIDAIIGATPGKAKNFAQASLAAGAVYTTAQIFDPDHAGRDAALAAVAGYVGPRLKSYITGRNLFLKEMKKGSASDLINRAIDSGVVFGSEKGLLEVDDAGRRFYDAMKLIQKEVDRITSPVGIKGGKAVEKYIEANHILDSTLWGRIHPGMKLEVWSKTSDTLLESSIKRNAKDPKTRILTRSEADQIAARFTNDTFGGLNWTRIAMEAKTRIGRMVAQELFSARGRQALRIGLFAPDWTLSTARAALTAVDADLINPLKWGNVAKGMFQPITRGDLARQYIARSAMYYLVIGDAINYSMSGHHLWQNKDPTFIDWGDGRRMLFSKHIMEVPHWFDHPGKQALGKLGYVPKEVANQFLGTDYLAPQEGKQGQVFAGPRMKDKSLMGRVEHAASGFTPIPFQGEKSDATAWGFAGMPLYGKTAAQKVAAKRLREENKRKERK